MAIIAAIVYLLQRLAYPLPSFINNYLNDLLAIPLTCWIILIVIRKFKQSNFILTPLMIVMITLYFSVYFEWYLPQDNERYTGDYLDILCYSSGGIIYFLLQKHLFFTKTKIHCTTKD